MNYFSHYPYQNFSDYNLDWLMKLVKEVNEKLSEYLENSVITFADPITWDITEQYTALTCVVDSDGTAYLSKQPVPAGVDISNTNYWLPIFNYDDNINTLRSQIAYNARNSATTAAALTAGDLVFWHGLIYKATADIPAGSALIIGSNIEKFTVDEKINGIQGDITNIQGDIIEEENARIAADDALQDNITAEEAARIAADNTLQENITAEENARIAAVNALVNQINNITLDFVRPEDYGAVGDGITDDTAALTACFNDAAQTNKYVKLDGNYALYSQILLPSNLTVKGYGVGKFTDRAEFPSSQDIHTYGLLFANVKKNITFSGVNFTGTGAVSRYTRKYTFLAETCENILFTDCIFTDQPGIASIYCRASSYVWVWRCQILEYSRAGVQFVEGTTHAGVFYTSVINGHETNSGSRYPIMLCGYDENYEGLTAPQGSVLYAIGNYIHDDNPWWEGIDAHGGDTLYVANNTMSNIATPLSIFTNANRGFTVRNAWIHDNFCYAPLQQTDNPSTLYGNSFGGNNLFIYNNYFRNGGKAYQTDDSCGVYLNAGRPIHFNDNVVSNSHSRGIALYGTYAACLLKGNEIDGVTGGTTNIGIDLRNANILNDIHIKDTRFMGGMTHVAAPPTKTNTAQYIRLDGSYYENNVKPRFINAAYISPDKATEADIALSTCCYDGDICINANPAVNHPIGWIGTGATYGTGTWRALPNLS